MALFANFWVFYYIFDSKIRIQSFGAGDGDLKKKLISYLKLKISKMHKISKINKEIKKFNTQKGRKARELLWIIKRSKLLECFNNYFRYESAKTGNDL